jgi:hypothetical protein
MLGQSDYQGLIINQIDPALYYLIYQGLIINQIDPALYYLIYQGLIINQIDIMLGQSDL